MVQTIIHYFFHYITTASISAFIDFDLVRKTLWWIFITISTIVVTDYHLLRLLQCRSLHFNYLIEVVTIDQSIAHRYERYRGCDGNPLYAVAGFTVLYEFYAYPEHLRPRFSQMLVLPPFQKMGVGTALLETVYKKYNDNPKVLSITGKGCQYTVIDYN